MNLLFPSRKFSLNKFRCIYSGNMAFVFVYIQHMEYFVLSCIIRHMHSKNCIFFIFCAWISGRNNKHSARNIYIVEHHTQGVKASILDLFLTSVLPWQHNNTLEDKIDHWHCKLVFPIPCFYVREWYNILHLRILARMSDIAWNLYYLLCQ